MGTRTHYEPGTFSWVDLTTDDADVAKHFYGSLLGWEFDEFPTPGGGVYSMAKVGGESVAGIGPSTTMAPPRWNSYVTVASADATAARAAELGAEIIEPPFDVGESVGRMALLADPTGASLCIWEARGNIGAGRVNDPGCLTWNELHSPDPDTALAFHQELFGWNALAVDTGGGPAYTVIQVGERSNGGVMHTQPGEPASWLAYFTVPDRDSAASQALALGADELHRMEMPQGRIAVLSDPRGATFAIFEGEVDD